MKKFLILLFALLFCQSAGAVLKEENLAATLSVLRAELEAAYKEQKQNMTRYNRSTEAQHKQMVSLMQRSDQTALMLYSQKQDFTFDMTYACHEATEQYREFSKQRMPYDKMLSRINSEIDRYSHLITSLRQIPPSLDKPQKNAIPDSITKNKVATKGKEQPFTLSAAGIADRKVCLQYATALLKNLQTLKKQIEQDNEHYGMVSQKLKRVNDYAVKRYNNLQTSIFVNGDESYFSLLGSLSTSMQNAKNDFQEKYATEKTCVKGKGEKTVLSQWRGPIVFGLTVFVFFYIIIAALLSNVLIRWFVPKRFRTEEFIKKKVCIILASAMIIFALSVMIVRTFMTQNFFLMASKLLIEFAWLLSAIFVSLLIRLPGEQIKRSFRIYTPIMLMAFIVIAFRIVFIPNNMVNLIFPPILLLFTLWQWNAVGRHSEGLPRYDVFYTYISLTIMVFSTCAAWYGYTLLSVQILIWWTFQLACVQTITCIYDLLASYKKHYIDSRIARFSETSSTAKQAALVKQGIYTNSKAKKSKTSSKKNVSYFSKHEEYIHITWFFDFITMVVVPVLGVFSVLMSIWWASDVFDLTDTVMNIFMTNFISIPNYLELSLAKLVLVAALFFFFRYLNYLLRALYHRYRKPKAVVDGKPNFTLANNIIAICVWGVYAIMAIKTLKIPSTAISVISAGLATGIGFAMKDLLNNFFYGISLMAGRVRVGDFIECDGVRGKVESITYQSTQIATADGCVIAFLNSSLFSKNFKNITKNHAYELVTVPVGIAYGANVNEVRQMIIESVKELMIKNREGRDIISSKKPIDVVFSEFGDNSVNLLVTYWVLVEEKFAMTCKVKEAVYNTLNAHNIEIPFPQREIRILNTK